jgi:shikimate kinase
MNKTIYILIGPKGSGKSYIGTLMDQYLGIKFIRVEDIWLKLKKEKNFKSEKEYYQNIHSFYKEGTKKVIETISKTLETNNSVVIESLGIGTQFGELLTTLQELGKTVLIKIVAEEYICLERIKKRDQSIHIAVSDNKVLEINEEARKVSLPFDFKIQNDHQKKEDIIDKLRSVVTKASSN